MTYKEMLNLEFYSKDLGQKVTIAEWFKRLFFKLICEREAFSSYRPFGNSDWDGDVIICLIKNGLVKGKVDQDTWIDECDWSRAETLIAGMAKELLNYN